MKLDGFTYPILYTYVMYFVFAHVVQKNSVDFSRERK